MAYGNYQKKEDKTLHKSGMVIYSWRELLDWTKNTKHSEEEHRMLLAKEAVAMDPLKHGAGSCPVCGWPQGQRGYIRANALPTDWAFGKLFACPRCWPWPLGKSKGSLFLNNEQEQAEACGARLTAKGL